MKVSNQNAKEEYLKRQNGDNSSLTASEPSLQSEKMPVSVPQSFIIESEFMGSKLISFLCYAKENSTTVREFRERLKSESWVDPWFDQEVILPG